MKPSCVCGALATAVGLLLSTYSPAIAYPLDRISNSSADSKSQMAKPLPAKDLQQLADEAWQVVEKNYFDPNFNGLNWKQVRKEILSRRYATTEEVYTAIRAMLGRLNNPATRLLTPQQFAGFAREDSGQSYVGVGLPELLSLDIDEQTRQLTVVTPVPNTPASRAGLMSGDRVVKIDGVLTDGMDLGDASERLRGTEAKAVRLTIRRKDSTFDVTLRKEEIASAVSSVRATLETAWGGRQVGYIILPRFAESSAQQMREAIARLESADGFVLDLRNNPGGGVVALQEIAGLFLGKAPIATLEGRSGTTEFLSTGTQLTDKPLVVLVNEGTASAAELLAGALQDSKRAVVIGMPTFGKGLVHGFFPLKDGGAIALTVGQLQTPNGNRILNVGITPDVRVEMASSPLLNPAIELASWSDFQYRQAIEQIIMRTKSPFPVGKGYLPQILAQRARSVVVPFLCVFRGS